MSNNPLVSVIMPSYNSEKYIGEAIDSILNQTYNNLELIIVDDCSSDNTIHEIESRTADSRLLLYRNPENMGIAYTTNYGIEKANGEFIALLDDDDIAFPNRIELQVNFLEQHPEIDILGGRSMDVDEQGEYVSEFPIPRYNPRYVRAMLLIQCVDFRNGTTMIRHDFIRNNKLKYKDDYLGMQDYRFFMEASKIGNISTIPDFILKWRMHGDNETFRQMNGNSEKRKQLYAQIQKDSFQMSGFQLDQSDYETIIRIYSETHDGCKNIDDLDELYCVTKKILKQADEMKADYYDELEHYLKRRLCDQMIRVRFAG